MASRKTKGQGRLANRSAKEWSPSKSATLAFCPRQYYYSAIGAWQGWLKGRAASRKQKQLYLLGCLEAANTWAGHIVHDTIETFLLRYQKNPQGSDVSITFESMYDYAKAKFEREWRASLVHNRSAFYRDPKKYWRLAEHYYGTVCEKDAWWLRIERCLHGFIDSAWPEICVIPPRQWLDIEEGGAGVEPPHFFIDLGEQQIKVWSVIDFSCRHGAMVQIWDWKTGKRSETHNLQLGTYTMYATAKWGVSAHQIELITAYLGEEDHRSRLARVQAASLNLEEIRRVIREQILLKQSYYDDIANSLAEEQNFEPRPTEAKCVFCGYRALCPASPVEVRGVVGDVEVLW